MDVLRHFSAIGLEKSAGLVDASSVRCRDSRVNRVYALMNSHARAPTMDVLFSAQTFEQTAIYIEMCVGGCLGAVVKLVAVGV